MGVKFCLPALALATLAIWNTPCHAALPESGYVTDIHGDVFLKTTGPDQQPREYHLSPKDNGIVLYSNEYIRCAKDGECKVHLFPADGEKKEKIVAVSKDYAETLQEKGDAAKPEPPLDPNDFRIAATFAGHESNGEQLDSDGYRIAGISGADDGSETPPPPGSRKKMAPQSNP